MNIFYLDNNIEKCAEYHCDKHVVKMILEYAQLLSTTCRLMGFDVGYKITHQSHPCAIWTRQSEGNFLYLVSLQEQLNNEFKTRFSGSDHKSFLLVQNSLPLPKFKEKTFCEPPKCVPNKFKNLDTVEAYRAYYKEDKAYFCTWKNKKPFWF